MSYGWLFFKGKYQLQDYIGISVKKFSGFFCSVVCCIFRDDKVQSHHLCSSESSFTFSCLRHREINLLLWNCKILASFCNYESYFDDLIKITKQKKVTF